MSCPPATPTARFVLLIKCADENLIAILTHRFKLEYGLSSPDPVDLQLDAVKARWLALDYSASPDKLSSIQSHAALVEKLYPTKKARIDAGYVDPLRAVRAAREEGPNRLYLSDGLWSEVVLRRAASGELAPPEAAEPDPDWTQPVAMAFLNSIPSK